MSVFGMVRNFIDKTEQVVDSIQTEFKQAQLKTRSPQKSGISLEKGQRLTLEKDGHSLTKVNVGVDWGMIGHIAVDLDVSCVTYIDENVHEQIYFGNLRGIGIEHSGDDLVGDSGKGDGGKGDGLFNEIISIDMTKTHPDVNTMFIVLNSYRGHKFDEIPFATISLYEGHKNRVDNMIATYDVANEGTFKGAISMVLGKLYKHKDQWKFHAIGDATKDRYLSNIIQTINSTYL